MELHAHARIDRIRSVADAPGQDRRGRAAPDALPGVLAAVRDLIEILPQRGVERRRLRRKHRHERVVRGLSDGRIDRGARRRWIETACSSASARRSRSPHRRSRCARSRSPGSRGPARAARRRRESRPAPPACDRRLRRQSRFDSSARDGCEDCGWSRPTATLRLGNRRRVCRNCRTCGLYALRLCDSGRVSTAPKGFEATWNALRHREGSHADCCDGAHRHDGAVQISFPHPRVSVS